MSGPHSQNFLLAFSRYCLNQYEFYKRIHLVHTGNKEMEEKWNFKLESVIGKFKSNGDLFLILN